MKEKPDSPAESRDPNLPQPTRASAGQFLSTRVSRARHDLRNSLSDTWINYAVPIQVLADFIDKGRKGEYKPLIKAKATPGPAGFHGIILVPNVVERTPRLVDGVRYESPASKAGLLPDDLIIYVDGEPVSSIKAFNEYLTKTNPGQTIRLLPGVMDRGGAESLDDPAAPGGAEALTS